MAQQFYGSPFQPYTGGSNAGSQNYVGADAAKTLSQPTSGVAALPSDACCMYLSVEGGTIHVLRDGSTPTATVGIAYAAGVYFIENSREEMAAWRMYIPTGTTVNTEFGRGRV